MEHPMNKITGIVALGLAALVLARTTAVQRIVLIGDSTVTNYAASKAPMAGWGMFLGLYFQPGTVTVLNKAVGGRSSKSFVTLGQWAATLAELKAGDILMIQFGHNDRTFSDTTRYADTATYRQYLTKYVTEARAKGVHPVFVTPMNMNTWSSAGGRRVFTEGANDYRGAMIRAGKVLRVPVLDLELKSKQLMDSSSAIWLSKFHFLGLESGEYPNYPTGISDGTHFQEMGALANARMVVEEITRQSSDSVLKLLAPLVAPTYEVKVKSTLASGDTISRSTRMPVGAQVTVKVRPAAGKKFRHWRTESGDSLTGSLRYTFTMGAKNVSLLALYQGVVVGVPSRTADLGTFSVSRRGSLALVAGAGEGVVRLSDAHGRLVRQSPLEDGRARLDLSGLSRGVYLATTSGGVSVRLPVSEGAQR
jgi:lysophospholipase L1-like esterase